MIALLLEYDGTDYAGWQNQPNARTVQAEVERAVGAAFGTKADCIASGRTDTGVHARGQVVHVQFAGAHNNIPLHKIPLAVQTQLPRDIRVRAASFVEDNFHARYSAVSREYVYRISREQSVFTQRFAWTPRVPFRDEVLAEALSVFRGVHNFTAVSKHNPDTASYECVVEHCGLADVGQELHVAIRANRFVYGMCRGIIGAAMSVARGAHTIDELRMLLANASRAGQPPLAPPHGLALHCVRYANGIFEGL